MIETMCMLEMCFPHFFDMQEHLMIHLVRNCAHLEGSIMEYYTTEVVECTADYIKHKKQIGLPIPLHEGRLRGRGRMSQKIFIDKDYSLVSEAHFGVL
jgi:hypothetical protein